MARGNWHVEHLLRRAGFGPNADDLARFEETPVAVAVDYLVDYERQTDDVDSKIGLPAYVSVTTRGQFSPNTNIDDARQRWLFRMVHSQRPLQEKMSLFWHNHFATTYSKIAGVYGAVQGTRMLALKAGELPGPQGQIELFRQYALGNFRHLLLEVAKDPAMVVFLDGRTNVKAKPQENFGREVMELFTLGIGNYTEQDVYAAARVFTGWNLRPVLTAGSNDNPSSYYEFVYNAAQHDVTAKAFTFPIYSDGNKTIPARAAADGMQDGVDFITALATHPETARRLARKLWNFFISELTAPDPAFVEAVAGVYLENKTEMKPVIRFILRSQWFIDPAKWFARYSWPVEFVVRSIREIGWNGFTVDSARTPLTNMGQTLYEPPNVAGWELGPAWFSSGAMLSRMNFAATLAGNQRFNLARDAAYVRKTPDDVLTFFMDRLSPAYLDQGPYNDLLTYLRANAAWPATDALLQTKSAGLARLIVGSSEYQFV